jgi:glycosyltransferase involved in cell wall biosynthesis
MHRLSAMSVLMKIRHHAPEKLRGVPVFFDMDDIEHVAAFRRLVRDPGWPAERLLLMQLPSLVMAEVEAMRMAERTFVCSEPDRRYLSRFPGGGRVSAIPNSVTFPDLDPTAQTEQLILLVGAMGYRPNAQAADTLVQKIWPLVRSQVPGARVAIVGVGREQTVSYHSPQDGVTFTGFVDDLQPLYRRARVVCCPILHGGGTRVKIIEAAANAKAVISTRIGAEGLDFRDGHEIILKDDAAAIAQACIHLLEDSNAATRIGQAALAKARKTYERGVVVSQLGEIFRSGIAAGAGRHR